VLYEQQLGLTIERITPMPSLDALCLSISLPPHTLELITPAVPDRGPIAAILASEGEGPIQVTLGVRDLRATREHLVASGLDLEKSLIGDGPALRRTDSLGVRLAFIEVQ
jgi:hypothetical protein